MPARRKSEHEDAYRASRSAQPLQRARKRTPSEVQASCHLEVIVLPYTNGINMLQLSGLCVSGDELEVGPVNPPKPGLQIFAQSHKITYEGQRKKLPGVKILAQIPVEIFERRDQALLPEALLTCCPAPRNKDRRARITRRIMNTTSRSATRTIAAVM